MHHRTVYEGLVTSHTKEIGIDKGKRVSVWKFHFPRILSKGPLSWSVFENNISFGLFFFCEKTSKVEIVDRGLKHAVLTML